MLKYSIGYRPPAEGEWSIVEMVADYPAVDEVYFPWPATPSGRDPLAAEATERLIADMRGLRAAGVKLNLLLNASCGGGEGFSKAAAEAVRTIVGQAVRDCDIASVTAFSPLTAEVVRRNFPHLGVRASINLRIGTLEALEQTAELFDAYTIAREFNHDLRRLEEIAEWCRRRGKQFQLLANSGCIPWCAVQSFHDNLVAHAAQASGCAAYAAHIPGGCWSFYAERPESRHRFLAGTWIRPDDAHRYEALCPRLKLATRSHERMETVVRAYARGRFGGNLADLLEPGHGRVFAPAVVDNRRFPADWFKRKSAGDSYAEMDTWYRQVWSEVLTRP